MRLLTLTCLMTISAATVSANVLNITPSNDITDSELLLPNSFERDTQSAMDEWYLHEYVKFDPKSADREDNPIGEEETIRRLQSIPTVIPLTYNSVVQSYINAYTKKKRGLVTKMLGLSYYYMPIFEEALDRYGLPDELKYLPIVESALDPTAKSSAGATGLWQFMYDTGKQQGLEINSLIDERRDPYASSDAAARYLKYLYGLYKDWHLALAAYNCGPGRVNQAIRKLGGGKKGYWEIYYELSPETRGYVPAFIAAVYVMNYHDRHNIMPPVELKPVTTGTINVDKHIDLNQVSEVLGIPMYELHVLNPQYLTDKVPGHIHECRLVLPSMQTYCYIANEDSILNYRSSDFFAPERIDPVKASGQDGNIASAGEYVTKEKVRWHTVGRKENLKSIARKYGVTTKSIKNANGLKSSSLKRGQKLKIVTTTKVWVPAPTQTTVPADTIAAASQPTPEAAAEQNVEQTVAQTVVEPAASFSEVAQEDVYNQPTPEPAAPKKDTTKITKKETKKDTKPKTVTHTVKQGETLSKIAAKYGVTVDQIKKANGLKNDNLQINQKLLIPSKEQPKATKKKSGKTKKSSKKKRR